MLNWFFICWTDYSIYQREWHSDFVIRMMLELIKIDCLWIEVLSYMNVCEWIWKMTAYLKDKDFWISIKSVLEEWQTQKSDKMSEPASAEIAEVSEKADDAMTDLMIEKSILTHQALTEKQLKNSEKKNWQKTNYLMISTLLSIIFIIDQQTVENLKYAENIWLYVTKKYIKVNYFTLIITFVNYFRWEKNETQSVKKAAWDIEYLVNQILQLNESSMNIWIIKFLFLRDLSEVYESVC